MNWYLAGKDILDFGRTDRRIFIRMMIGMITCAFVMNFAYAFARYRGDLFSENNGDKIPRYRIECPQMLETIKVNQLLQELKNRADFPDIQSVTVIANNVEGMRVAGSTELTPNSSWLTGLWIEGYALPISKEEKNACAVNNIFLNYNEQLKMIGELYELGGEEYVIEGVYESFSGVADIVIYFSTFQEKFERCNSVWIVFDEAFNDKQLTDFTDIVKGYVVGCGIVAPNLTGNAGNMIMLSNVLQYTLIIILMIIFLASIMQYWYEVNRPTYAIYWVAGAKMRSILGIVFCETFMLSAVSYIVGLVFWKVVRIIVLREMPVETIDVLFGFALFYGTLTVLGLTNMIHICKKLSVKTTSI